MGESDWDEWWADRWSDDETADESDGIESNRDALETLRYRYER